VQTALRDLARVRIEHVSSTWSLELARRDLENVLAIYEAPRVDAAAQRLASFNPAGKSPAVKKGTLTYESPTKK
jgi:hypothetical protein